MNQDSNKGYLEDANLAAVIARAAWFIVAVFLVLISIGLVPSFRVFYSHHVAHFAAFYLTSFAAAAAMTRRQPYVLWLVVISFGAVLEVARAFFVSGSSAGYLDWISDAAGSLAALAPLVLQDFRRRFRPRIKEQKHSRI
jgi:hypothetical protein